MTIPPICLTIICRLQTTHTVRDAFVQKQDFVMNHEVSGSAPIDP